mgnify:CR=1 FL=1
MPGWHCATFLIGTLRKGDNVQRDVYNWYDASWLSPARAPYGLATHNASINLNGRKEMLAKINGIAGFIKRKN